MSGQRSATAVALSLASLAACGGGAALPREGEAAVRAYNEALILAYRTNDSSGLERVAGEREVRRLIALIDLKRAARLVLESRLEELEVLGVEAGGPEAMTVRTRERWRYWDRALEPGRAAGPVFVAEMWMDWQLRREGATWKVESGRTARTRYLEPPGFRLGARREAIPGRD